MSMTGSVERGNVLRGKLNGLKTIHGYSAYEVAVINGFSGTEEEWLASLKGNKGDKGDPGYTPRKGIDYFDGKNANIVANAFVSNDGKKSGVQLIVYPAIGAPSTHNIMSGSDANVTKENIEEALGYVPVSEDEETDAKFFNIDADGIVSLKPEYRGHPVDTVNSKGEVTLDVSEVYPYSVSDMGEGVNGSLIDELPEKIVFPEMIGDTAVAGFQPGMFQNNTQIKEIVFPDTVTEIPENFCYCAINLRSIRNTEHITTLGGMAFQRTRIEKALFPNLKELGTNAFDQCMYLEVADIGNEITEIPYRCFTTNVNLSLVKGGGRVTKIGERAFMHTENLKNLPLLKNVTEIANYGFLISRIQYDFSGIASDKLGQFAHPTQDNGSNKYWSDCTFTPCENRIVTAWNQRNLNWPAKAWGTWKGTGTLANGRTNIYWCAAMCMMHVHSAISGDYYDGLVGDNSFEEAVTALPNGAELLAKDCAPFENQAEILTALGHTTKHIGDTLYADDMQAIYDALAEGAYVIAAMSSTGNPNTGHVVVLYGVNDIGEVLVLDSDNGAHLFEVYDDLKLLTSHMPLQNFTGPSSDILIVRPKSQ